MNIIKVSYFCVIHKRSIYAKKHITNVNLQAFYGDVQQTLGLSIDYLNKLTETYENITGNPCLFIDSDIDF